MLDNFSPKQVRDAVKKLEEEGIRDKVLVEVSGRINEENVLEFASIGVDIISLGILTHSVKALDLSLEVKQVTA